MRNSCQAEKDADKEKEKEGGEDEEDEDEWDETWGDEHEDDTVEEVEKQ